MTRNRFGVLVALLALVVAAATFAIVVAVFDDDGPADPPGRSEEQAAPDAGATTTTSTPASTTTLAPGQAFWIAVVSSDGDEPADQADAARVADAGMPSGVLRSDASERSKVLRVGHTCMRACSDWWSLDPS